MSTENIRQTKMAITTFSNVSIWNQHTERISIKNTCYSVGGSDCYETFRNKTPKIANINICQEVVLILNLDCTVQFINWIHTRQILYYYYD